MSVALNSHTPYATPSPNPPPLSILLVVLLVVCTVQHHHHQPLSVETWPALAVPVCDLLLPCKLRIIHVTQLTLMRCC